MRTSFGVLLLIATAGCAEEPCPEGQGRVADGSCLDLVGGDTTALDTPGTDPLPPSEDPVLTWEFGWWPVEDEGFVVLNYQVDDAQTDVIGGWFDVVVSDADKAMPVHAPVIWREDTCPEGDHSAFYCAYLNEYGHLNMYVAGVDRVNDWALAATVTDKEGNASDEGDSVTSYTLDGDK